MAAAAAAGAGVQELETLLAEELGGESRDR